MSPRAQCTAIQFESRRANASQHDAAPLVPEIDWEKLALNNSSVYDIYTGLKLDEELR